MGNLGGMELLVIFLVGLMVLGPSKLPNAARQIGRAVNELRRVSGGFQRELRDAFEEPVAETRSMLDGVMGETPTPTPTPAAPETVTEPVEPPADPTSEATDDTDDTDGT